MARNATGGSGYSDEEKIINARYINNTFVNIGRIGIEINDRIARIAMMDMVIHDDGHTNIECNDALLPFDAFDPRRDIRPNKYNITSNKSQKRKTLS